MGEFAVLTDEATQDTHDGNDGRDAEALQAMVGWLTFLPTNPNGTKYTRLLQDVAQFNARPEWRQHMASLAKFQSEGNETDLDVIGTVEVPTAMAPWSDTMSCGDASLNLLLCDVQGGFLV